MTSLYCTLADVKNELLANTTVDDDKVMRGIRQLSARIDRKFSQVNTSLFAPYLETRYVPLSGENVSSWDRTLILRTQRNGVSPLLALTGVSINTQSFTVGTNVQLYPAGPAPYYALQLLGDGRFSWYDYCNTSTWGWQFAAVTGVWGYNADYANAWLPSDTLAAAVVSTSATTITVTNVDGENPLGETPAISAGNVIQIDDEWMNVVKTDIATNVVTVVRGVNGSTAATHLINASVSVWQTDENVRRICRQVALQYARRGAFNTSQITDFGVITFPPDLMTEIQELLQAFANL